MSDSDMAELKGAYLPRRSERVRIAEIAPFDDTPAAAVGDIGEVAFACYVDGRDWVQVRFSNHRNSTWCRVESVSP